MRRILKNDHSTITPGGMYKYRGTPKGCYKKGLNIKGYTYTKTNKKNPITRNKDDKHRQYLESILRDHRLCIIREYLSTKSCYLR